MFDTNSIDATPSASPDEFGKFVAAERERFRRIVEENNVPLL